MRTALAAVLAVLTVSPAFADSQPVHRCKSYVQGRIDVLDAELHKGSKPNEAHRLVERRERLKNQLAACERNPKAYKKEL
jgi:hypothetical protein